MALRRDTADAILYDALKLERHQLTQEIARLPKRNFESEVGKLTRRIEQIEKRMERLRELSPLALR